VACLHAHRGLSKFSFGLPLVLVLGWPAPGTTGPSEAFRVSVEIELPSQAPANVGPSDRLRAQLTARLLQDGFVVVPSEAEAEVGLRLWFRDPGWTIQARLAAETLARELTDCGILRSEEQLEIVQKATELVRRAQLRALSEAVRAAPPTRPSAVDSGLLVSREVVSTPETVRPIGIEGTTGIDLLIRGDHADSMARLGGRLGLGPHLGLHLVTGLSAPGDEPVYVLEWQTLIGFGYRIPANDRLSFEATAEGGLLLHHYRLQLLDAGNRVDPLAMIAFTGDVELWRHLGIELRIAPGLSNTRYTQALGAEAVWSRSRFRIEAGIGLVVK
jgi:hypothetical protein